MKQIKAGGARITTDKGCLLDSGDKAQDVNPQSRSPTLSPGDTQNPWAEDTLDGSFLGSGEELDLLSEILDSLNVETKSGDRQRASQSLDCCQQGASESCSSLVRTSSPLPPLHLSVSSPSDINHTLHPALPSLTSQWGYHGNWKKTRDPRIPSLGPYLVTCHFCKTPHFQRL